MTEKKVRKTRPSETCKHCPSRIGQRNSSGMCRPCYVKRTCRCCFGRKDPSVSWCRKCSEIRRHLHKAVRQPGELHRGLASKWGIRLLAYRAMVGLPLFAFRHPR